MSKVDIEFIKEKLNVFNKFHFEEEPHVYWWLDKDGNKKFANISMTQLIHKYAKPFDAQKIAPFSAKKMGISTKEVLDMWELSNEISKPKGTYIHKYAEEKWKGNYYTYPVQEVLDKFGYDPLEWMWPKLTKIVDIFYDDFKERVVPIGLELVIGDEELDICGSIDFLCYSYKLKSLIIVDYKSNKEIKTKPYKKQKMTGCLSHLDDCNYIHYSLQLNGYQYIFERQTGLKMHNNHYLIWINENNDTYKIYTTKDLYSEAKTMIEEGY